MTKRLFLASVAAAGAALAASAGPSAAVALASPPPTSDDPAAAQLAQDYNLSYSEAERRVTRQDQIASVAAALSSQVPDKFGGLWTDQQNGGVIVIYATASDPRFDRAIHNAGLDGQVVYRGGTHARSQLSAAYSYLASRVASVESTDSPVSVSDDEKNNVVTFNNSPGKQLTPQQQALYDDARNQYGDVVARAEVPAGQTGGSCAWPSCDPPLRGGLWINPNAYDGSVYCTSGLNVISQSNSAYYLLTAGHCMNDGATWYEKFQSDLIWHKIGSRWNSYFGSTGDAAIVTVDNVSGWSPQGIVYVRASSGAYPTTENPTYSIKYTGTANVGDYVCHTGATIGTRCGQVQVAQTSETLDGTSVGNLAQVGYTSCRGDSGGPTYRANTAYGIFVGLTSDAGVVVGPNGAAQTCGYTSWYSLIGPIMSNLHVNVLAGP